MLLKLIILAALGIMVYRFFGGKVPILDTKTSIRKKRTKPEKEETMVECSKCGTWVVIEEATLVQGKYYCDECIE
jgi:uncharacterized protein